MPTRIFYAWQSDRPSRTNKQFLRDVLDDVVSQLQQGSEVEEAERPEVEVDQDTQGEAGLVNVFASIQTKIISSDIFVCDLTHVCEYKHPDGRTKRAQNGNVLIELGFAMRNIDHRRIICVMNKKHGGGSGLPFDLNLYRHPVGYELGQHATDDDVVLERARLATDMKVAVEASLQALAADRAIAAEAVAVDRAAHGRLRAAAVRQKLKADITANTLSRFDATGPMIAMTFVPLIEGQSMSLPDVRDREQHLRPLASDFGLLFNDVDSMGTTVADEGQRVAVTRMFDDGSAIGAAAIARHNENGREIIMYYWSETRLIQCVTGLIRICKANGIAGPWEVSASLWNVAGRSFKSDFRWDMMGRFEDNLIEAKPVTIPADIDAEDEQEVAKALKLILDGFWRAYGFNRCLRFRADGTFALHG